MPPRRVPFWKAVKMMRHRDPRLTWQVYTELGLLDTRDEAAKLAEGPRRPWRAAGG